MGGGGTVTNTRQFRKRERQRQAHVVKAFGVDYDEKCREAALRPTELNPDGSWKGAGETWGGAEINMKPQEWNYVPPPAKSDKELEIERVEKNLEGWPWTGAPKKLVTLAPFAFNTYEGSPFEKARNDQKDSGLMRLLKTSIIQEQISDLLFQHHATAWKFAATCQEATAKLGLSLHFWDITSGWFNNCEKSRVPKQFQPTSGPYFPEQNGSVASIVVVTPIRRQTEPPKYTEQLDHLYTMCYCISNWSDYIRNIQLHRVPFLTTELLSLLVPKMANLKVLGVYKCPLIHIGRGSDLLNIIKTDRPLGRENQVYLDFYPNFHVGPILEDGNEFAIGGFGVTWDNWPGPAVTDKATWAIAYRLIRQAKLQGIDMYSQDTMFKKFLDSSMCWDVDNTLSAILTAFSIDELHPGHSGFVRVPQFTHRPDGSPIHEDDYASIWPDLCKAACLIDRREKTHLGDFVKFTTTNEVFRPEGYQWTIQPYHCAACDEDMIGIFFNYQDIQCFHIETLSATPTPTSPILCLGCKLSHYLDSEFDHYKSLKRSIIKSWLYTEPSPDESDETATGWNNANLPLALEQFESRGIRQLAERLDTVRKVHVMKFGFDRETQERQNPLSGTVLKAKRGNFQESPRLGEWQAILDKKAALQKALERDPRADQWGWKRDDRYAGHHKYQ